MVSIQEIARLPYFPTLCRRMEKLSEYCQRLATTYAVCLACVPMTTFTSIAATYFRLKLQWLLTHTDPCRAIARRSECFCCCYCKCSWQKKKSHMQFCRHIHSTVLAICDESQECCWFFRSHPNLLAYRQISEASSLDDWYPLANPRLRSWQSVLGSFIETNSKILQLL